MPFDKKRKPATIQATATAPRTTAKMRLTGIITLLTTVTLIRATSVANVNDDTCTANGMEYRLGDSFTPEGTCEICICAPPTDNLHCQYCTTRWLQWEEKPVTPAMEQCCTLTDETPETGYPSCCPEWRCDNDCLQMIT
ncbi:PREDICTED: uncharacterized protein LOC106807719 isoform X2 [Priapulus caudatus]|uniref:Uncharacterized protein LOC106807719 isoform X2 n=1 Tax=Priapulus caudatus TaxID=37621 RepID=A0ABM1E0D1_PRICU|nr:PREDICTED: uncharacterized protein LOC106807719 isoform X2 [Priapulus caudatus]